MRFSVMRLLIVTAIVAVWLGMAKFLVWAWRLPPVIDRTPTVGDWANGLSISALALVGIGVVYCQLTSPPRTP